MKKGIQSKFTVKRLSSSPYFSPYFARLEKETIEKNPLIKMFDAEDSVSNISDILITNTHTIPENLSADQLKSCQLMIHPNSGYDNFSYDFVQKANFPIVIGNPIRAHAVSNFILSGLFSHYCENPIHQVWNKERKWSRKLINELTILIIGHGHIGKTLAQSLAPLVGELKIYDPYLDKNKLELKNTDVVILACSLNQKNQGIVNSAFLSQLNPDFLLINAARGALVKTQDLIEILKKQNKAFAILDVFDKEPYDFSLFSEVKNVKLSSHIAGVFSKISEVTAQFEAAVINDFLAMDEVSFQEKYQTMMLKNRLNTTQKILI